jgi:hypothetical protein
MASRYNLNEYSDNLTKKVKNATVVVKNRMKIMSAFVKIKKEVE